MCGRDGVRGCGGHCACGSFLIDDFCFVFEDCCEHWNSHPGGKIRLGLIVAHRNAARGGASGQEVEAGAAAGGATLQGASAQRTRARLQEWANPNLNSTRVVYRVLSR